VARIDDPYVSPAVTYREIHNSKQFRDEYGMLTNDSVILAVMRWHKLVRLVTNDDDFKRVSGVKVWLPRELGA
jgi:predicted nucleic acid-binding protein